MPLNLQVVYVFSALHVNLKPNLQYVTSKQSGRLNFATKRTRTYSTSRNKYSAHVNLKQIGTVPKMPRNLALDGLSGRSGTFPSQLEGIFQGGCHHTVVGHRLSTDWRIDVEKIKMQASQLVYSSLV